MNLRTRRRLGLTIPKLCAAARAVQEEMGVSLRDCDRQTAAGYVAAMWAKQNEMTPESPGIDWDAILAFVEQLIPLILALIELFSD